MAGPWYVDDGGDGTTEDSWATADTSIKDLDAEKSFASGEIVYFGHNHVCQATHSTALTIVGPTDGIPVTFISATQGSIPPSYAASTSNQIDTSEGAYNIQFDGSFALYGLCMLSGSDIRVQSDFNEAFYAKDCTFKLADSKTFYFSSSANKATLENCTIDLSADTSERTSAIFQNPNVGAILEINGGGIVGGANRSGTCFRLENNDSQVFCSGFDFSSLTHASTCEIVFSYVGRHYFNNCLTAATWTPAGSGTWNGTGEALFVNCGPEDSPTYLYHEDRLGKCVSSTAIYRTGGAEIETAATAWLITTSSICAESLPYKSQYIYGEVASTGSKTFDVYITNDTADFTDAEVWLEVEYLGTTDEANTTLASDRRVITAAAAAQTDDTTSTWNGTGPSFTYKQKLSVTATVGEAGQYRARVCVGVSSIASSRYFYIDPKVTVS